MDHLFVYGTLLSNASDTLGAAMRKRLASETLCVGRGATPGRLYDLGDYPGLVEIEPRERSLVSGEVLELHNPIETFRWLDLYEDVDLVDPAAGLYRRVPQLSMLNDGRAIRCWVYVLNREPALSQLVAKGCWLSHIEVRLPNSNLNE